MITPNAHVGQYVGHIVDQSGKMLPQGNTYSYIMLTFERIGNVIANALRKVDGCVCLCLHAIFFTAIKN